MPIYRDAEKREWRVRITSWEVMRCKDEISFNLCGIFDDNAAGFRELFNDTSTMGKVLWTICDAQAEKDGVDKQTFFSALAGDAIQSAIDALREAVINFFPTVKQPRVRRVFEQAEREEEWRAQQFDAMASAIHHEMEHGELVIEAIEKAIANLQLEKNSTKTSLRSPASVASTPDPSLCAS